MRTDGPRRPVPSIEPLLKSPRATLDDDYVAFFMDLIESSGVCEELAQDREQRRAKDGKRPGGRRASFDDRLVLTMYLALAATHTPLLVTRMSELIEHRLSAEAKQMLGIDPAITGDPLYYRCWRAQRSLLRVIDPYPAPRNRRLTKAEGEAIDAARNDAEVEAQRQKITRVMNRLLEATIRLLPPEVLASWGGNVSIDGTPMTAFAREGTYKSAEFESSERDAGTYARAGDHRGDPTNKSKTYKWAFEIIIGITAPDLLEDMTFSAFPNLAVGVSMDKPGVDVAGNGMRVINSIVERGHPRGHVVADLGYLPNSVPAKFQNLLRKLGYKLVFDYRRDQLGKIKTFKGASLIEGKWYCPAMPDDLVKATVNYRGFGDPDKKIDAETYDLLIAQRSRYRVRVKDRLGAHESEGGVAMRCPAAGPSATAICPLKKVLGNSAGRTVIHAVPENPSAICTNRSSVTFPAKLSEKYGQELEFESPKWRKVYRPLRSMMEGFNGFVKDPNYEALSVPGRRRSRGYAAQFLFATLLLMSGNLRALVTFLTKEPTTQISTKTRTSRRRNRDT